MIAPAGRTLRRIFEDDYAPSHLLAPRTLSGVRQHLSQWERITGDPQILEIDRHTLNRFRNQALAEGKADSTVRGWLLSVMSILNFAAEPSAHQPDALGLIASAPFVRKPRPRSQPKPAATLAQVAACYRSAEAASWPRIPGVSPGQFWRTWLVVSYNTGLRRNDILFRLEWEHFEFESDTLRFMARKTGKVHVLPVAGALRVHLERMPTARHGRFESDSRVFPVGRSLKQVRRELDVIAKAAGVAKITPQMIRCLSAIQYEIAHPGAGALLTGHAVTRVTWANYVPVPEVLREASKKLPQPWDASAEVPDDADQWAYGGA